MSVLANALAKQYKRWRLTVPELAKELGYAEGTVRNKINRGEFSFVYKDRKSSILFADVRDVAAYLEKQRPLVGPDEC